MQYTWHVLNTDAIYTVVDHVLVDYVAVSIVGCLSLRSARTWKLYFIVAVVQVTSLMTFTATESGINRMQ